MGSPGRAHEGAEAGATAGAGLPYFRHHPDPVATGSVRASTRACACCGQARGWIYTATFYSAQEIDGPFCTWCIADGSAADRFTGEFADSYGLDGISRAVLHEVTRRTPGFSAWQDPHWLVHCRDAAAFLGEADYPELARHPEALAGLRSTPRLDGRHDENQPERFLTHLGQGSATALLSRCTVCATELAYADAS
ncbi:CbrC family protein [Streptomyces albidoflavus]|uniref:CbrC family protein n=1 Tax=Streptomyces albidoflavus TaxID=1886 RepID=UPI0033B9D354